MNVNKCILLSRVSTSTQQLDDQTKQLKDEAIRLGYNEKNIIIIEDVESGIKLRESERHGLNELKRNIESNVNVDCVICWEISRIARRQNVLFSIRDYLLDKGIQLIVLQPYLRMIDANGKLDSNANIVFSLFGTLAENEMTLKKERFKRAKDALKAQGKWISGKVMFGYRTNKDKYIEIYEPEAKYVREIFNEYGKNNMSLQKIYDEYATLGVFAHANKSVAISRIRAMILHLGYSGRHRLNYPAIVTPELQDNCIKIMKGRPDAFKTKSKYIYYGKSLCRCGECGKVMIANSTTNAYKCAGYYHGGKENNFININVVDSVIWMCAKVAANIRMSLNKNKTMLEFQKKIETINIKIDNINKNIDDLNTKLTRAFKMYIDGKVPDSIYENESHKINAEIERWTKELNNLIAQKNQIEAMIQDDITIDDKIKDVDNITDENERREIILSVIDNVKITKMEDGDQKIEVEYKTGLILPEEEYYVYRRKGHKMMLFSICGGIEDDISTLIEKRFENNKWRANYIKK